MNSATNSKKSHRWSLNPSVARARASDRARGRETDEGITLVEIMVAFTLLMVTMVPIGYLLDSTVAAANTARQKEAALQLADSWIEILSNSSPPQTGGAVTTNQWTTPAAPAGA
jgi:Tfp pilus assembly protein PilV